LLYVPAGLALELLALAALDALVFLLRAGLHTVANARRLPATQQSKRRGSSLAARNCGPGTAGLEIVGNFNTLPTRMIEFCHPISPAPPHA